MGWGSRATVPEAGRRRGAPGSGRERGRRARSGSPWRGAGCGLSLWQHREAVLKEYPQLAAGWLPQGERSLPLALHLAQHPVDQLGGRADARKVAPRSDGAEHAAVQALDGAGRVDRLANGLSEGEAGCDLRLRYTE